MNDKHDLAIFSREQVQSQLTFNAYLLGIFATLLAVISVFSFPFPYVRQYWIEEIWGISGLINACLFFAASRSIEKFALPAGFAALGIILNEQVLAWTGFLYLLQHGPLAKGPVLFMIGSVIVSFFLGMILFDVIRRIWIFRKKFSHEISLAGKSNVSYRHLMISVFGYAAALAVIFLSAEAAPFFRYALLKVVGGLTAAAGFAGAGIELLDYLEKKQNRFNGFIKAVSHLLMVAGILWVIYRSIPVGQVIILSS